MHRIQILFSKPARGSCLLFHSRVGRPYSLRTHSNASSRERRSSTHKGRIYKEELSVAKANNSTQDWHTPRNSLSSLLLCASSPAAVPRQAGWSRVESQGPRGQQKLFSVKGPPGVANQFWPAAVRSVRRETSPLSPPFFYLLVHYRPIRGAIDSCLTAL